MTDYLTDREIRELPPVVIGCEWCLNCGSTRNLQRAHIRAVGMGGKRAKQGPRVMLCADCHLGKLHDKAYRYRLEVTRDSDVMWCDGDDCKRIGGVG